MKKIVIVSSFVIFCSCGKDDPGIKGPNPNNHMEATVAYSSGATIYINETGANVSMGIDFYLLGSFADVKNNTGLSVSVIDPYGNANDSTPYCNFYIHGTTHLSDSTFSSRKYPGDTLIYTVNNDSYKEGNFHFTCTYNSMGVIVDTVIVNGSFKGSFEW